MTEPGAGLPLRPGDHGDGVADLQDRLVAAGFDCADDDRGNFGQGTDDALRRFRISRRLPPASACDESTWAALVEAGWRLGDRLLYLDRPPKRGDDVATLQYDLGALGFDAGKVDGIFDNPTHKALVDFQRNAGLEVDGIFGPRTLHALQRVRRTSPDAPVPHVLREEEAWRCLGGLTGKAVAIAEGGGLGGIVDQVRRHLGAIGAVAVAVHHPDGSKRADEANRLEAAVYVGVEVDTAAGSSAAYYASPRTSSESKAGRQLAELLSARVASGLGIVDLGAEGSAQSELRETRMPAVICRVGPASLLAERAAVFAELVGTSLRDWSETADQG